MPPKPQLVLYSSVTPVLQARGQSGVTAQDLLNVNDITNRRAQPDVPFFAEEGAGDRAGPLPTSLGLLQDLSQIAEAAQFHGGAMGVWLSFCCTKIHVAGSTQMVERYARQCV